ncbi:hypothetical protein C8N46_107239 [Kordia periserrulae]|jgi:hypothetical protein|uniref:Uncharacterized protein n=1 Tax=Kordia periserrulae TaxID=701523 RepID=A0A2T6BVY2_9FLAO|nr:hypothetical protein [Kordia periserrulae]PTX60232.1 hypothetical protein C8N46_107239 [Kordia periserrulae]
MDFVSITSDDNWFKQHPEKIAGKEYVTTSLYFPVMVKGTKQDVLRVTKMNEKSKENKIRIAKAKAIALQLKRKRYESLQR